MNKRKLLTESEKSSIIEEYLTTDVSSRTLADRYGISYGTILCWAKEKNNSMGNIKSKRSSPKAESKLTDLPDYLLEIRRLEKQLEKVELEKEFYKEIINLAEKDLGVSLKKNFDKKQ